MEGIKIITFVFLLCGFHFCTVQSKECLLEPYKQGEITSKVMSGGEKCWTIPVPTGYVVYLHFTNFQITNHCDIENVRINVTGRLEYLYCHSDDVKKQIIAFANVTVIHYVRYSGVSSTVSMNYTVEKMRCKNKKGFFKCNDSCIPQEKLCDRVKDCKNGEDEMGCGNFPCEESSFKCYDNLCIPQDKVCNRIRDCKNGEDEFGCGNVQSQNCALEPYASGKIYSNGMHSGYEKCWTIPIPTGHLIHFRNIKLEMRQTCNDENVLINVTGKFIFPFCNSQEVKNPVTAFGDVSIIHYLRYAPLASYVAMEYEIEKIKCKNREGFFECYDQSCVPQENLCDGTTDCKDGEDEKGCGNIECLKNNSFKCYDFSCIPYEKVCDGVKDCRDGEDELACEKIECLKNGSFICDDASCIPEEKVCDGVEDEVECGNSECLKANSFKCNDDSCVSQEKICDRVKDCKNGEDEIGCVVAIDGNFEARHKAAFQLKKQRTSSWGWKENTPRAVVALYLASAVNFNGSSLEEETMAKQTDFKTAVALLRPFLTNSELSMFINALLVTCHNPRQFYGVNLVKRLKEQVEASENTTHPLDYLTLCNAKETQPQKATSDLNKSLRINSEYPFVKDLQAMAVMALSCEWNRNGLKNDKVHSNTIALYNETIQHFKKLQTQDGSFGNVHTTALIMQALLSSGQQLSKDYKLNSAIRYLMKELNSSSVDFLATYFCLPVLNGKSLIDIARVNCSAHPRKHGEDPISDPGPKKRIQYSLYIGEEKDTVHSISRRVPLNYTALEVMKSAADEDPKFRFQWKTTSGKMYVYQIANLTNDPEAEKFWLLYVGAANCSETLTHLTKGPDDIIMRDGEHLVFWYKKATFDYEADE